MEHVQSSPVLQNESLKPSKGLKVLLPTFFFSTDRNYGTKPIRLGYAHMIRSKEAKH